MAHKGHPACPFTSQAACDRDRHERLGKCTELTADRKNPKPCRNWAESLVNGRGVCNEHAGRLLAAELEAERKRRHREEVNARIDRYIEWKQTHPHVWDRMEAG